MSSGPDKPRQPSSPLLSPTFAPSSSSSSSSSSATSPTSKEPGTTTGWSTATEPTVTTTTTTTTTTSIPSLSSSSMDTTATSKEPATSPSISSPTTDSTTTVKTTAPSPTTTIHTTMDPSVTSNPPVTTLEPPTTTDPVPTTDPVTTPPVTTPPVTTPPVTTPPDTTTDPPVTSKPVTTDPPETSKPVTTDPPVTSKPNTTSDPPITTKPITTDPVITTEKSTTAYTTRYVTSYTIITITTQVPRTTRISGSITTIYVPETTTTPTQTMIRDPSQPPPQVDNSNHGSSLQSWQTILIVIASLVVVSAVAAAVLVGWFKKRKRRRDLMTAFLASGDDPMAGMGSSDSGTLRSSVPPGGIVGGRKEKNNVAAHNRSTGSSGWMSRWTNSWQPNVDPRSWWFRPGVERHSNGGGGGGGGGGGAYGAGVGGTVGGAGAGLWFLDEDDGIRPKETTADTGVYYVDPISYESDPNARYGPSSATAAYIGATSGTATGTGVGGPIRYHHPHQEEHLTGMVGQEDMSDDLFEGHYAQQRHSISSSATGTTATTGARYPLPPSVQQSRTPPLSPTATTDLSAATAMVPASDSLTSSPRQQSQSPTLQPLLHGSEAREGDRRASESSDYVDGHGFGHSSNRTSVGSGYALARRQSLLGSQEISTTTSQTHSPQRSQDDREGEEGGIRPDSRLPRTSLIGGTRTQDGSVILVDPGQLAQNAKDELVRKGPQALLSSSGQPLSSASTRSVATNPLVKNPGPMTTTTAAATTEPLTASQQQQRDEVYDGLPTPGPMEVDDGHSSPKNNKPAETHDQDNAGKSQSKGKGKGKGKALADIDETSLVGMDEPSPVQASEEAGATLTITPGMFPEEQ